MTKPRSHTKVDFTILKHLYREVTMINWTNTVYTLKAHFSFKRQSEAKNSRALGRDKDSAQKRQTALKRVKQSPGSLRRKRNTNLNFTKRPFSTFNKIKNQDKIKIRYLPWPVWLSGLGVFCTGQGHRFDSWSGHMPGWGFSPQLGHIWEATNGCFPLFLPPFPSL